MICRNGDCTHEGRRYVFGLGRTRQLTVLCDDCARSLSAIGMSIRAESPEPVDPRPRWLRNLSPKDMTGGLAG